jgi:hypothetical protein
VLYVLTVLYCIHAAVGRVETQEAKYVERWPNTTSAWAGADLIFQWIGMVENIPY